MTTKILVVALAVPVRRRRVAGHRGPRPARPPRRVPVGDIGRERILGEVERLIEKSTLEWTFLRAGGFATDTLGWAEQIRTGATVRWPYGAAARSLIHERDIAVVAVPPTGSRR